MADCTVADILTDAMSQLGDPDAELTQELFADFETAYSELMSALLKFAAPEIQREVYYTVPANTNLLFPIQLGVTDFAEPSQIWERGSVGTTSITSITDGSPITIVTAGGLSGSNLHVELNSVPGVPNWVNRDWYLTATGAANTYTLNGSISTGVGGVLATSGNVMWSSDQWQKMRQIDILPPAQIPILGEYLGAWFWQDRIIYFPNVSSLPRQVWIEYLADETPPAVGTVGLLDGREKKFLSHATAAHFAPKRQMPQGAQCAAWAYGPSGQPDSTGGFLRELILPVLKQKNSLPRRSQPYRLRRGQLVYPYSNY
jgi:hypothetical protein